VSHICPTLHFLVMGRPFRSPTKSLFSRMRGFCSESIFDSAAKPHQIRVFGRPGEKRALKKKDLDYVNSPEPAQDVGFATESIFKG